MVIIMVPIWRSYKFLTCTPVHSGRCLLVASTGLVALTGLVAFEYFTGISSVCFNRNGVPVFDGNGIPVHDGNGAPVHDGTGAPGSTELCTRLDGTGASVFDGTVHQFDWTGALNIRMCSEAAQSNRPKGLQ